MAEQEVTNSLSSGQSPLDLSLIEEVMPGQKSPSLLDPPSRKRKLSSAAGSAEQERQNEKEARIASSTQLSGSSTPNSEGSGRLISDDESNPQSEGTNGAPQTAPQTIARKHEHLTSAIASQAQEHEVRRHEIGLQGVMIKNKVDMVVAHTREESKRLTNENIQILERKQQTLGKSDNVTSGHDMQYLPTLKHVSYKPEPISKLDIVPLIGDVNDGTPPPTQGHSTYGIGKGFKSLEIPSTPEGQPTYRIGKFPQTLEINNQCRNVSTCGIGERMDNPELSDDNPSVSTPGHLPADNPSVSTPDHLPADNPSVSTPDHLSADNPSVSTPGNLPADNLSVSTPGNLPADNPSVSTPGNLPADNPSVSTPDHLPADNPSVSTPDHLSADNPSVSTPDHLSADNPSVSTPGNLPADNPSVSTPGNLPADNLSVSTPDHLPADNPSVSTPGNLPADNLSVSTPNNLQADNLSVSTPDHLSADNPSVSTPGNLSADNPSVSTPNNLSADNHSGSTPDNRPSCIGSDINASEDQLAANEVLPLNSDLSDLQNDLADLARPEFIYEMLAEILRSSDSSNVSVIASFRHSENMQWFGMCQHTTLKLCWLHDNRNKIISLFDKEGTDQQTIHIDFTAFSITMVESNKLLMCNGCKCISQILLPDNTISTSFLTPFIPAGICVTPTGELLVAMSESYDEITENSFVVKYETTGHEIMRSQFDNNLFMWPYKLTVNHRGDRVAVVNYTSLLNRPLQSHLVMLNGDLELVSRYMDHGVSVSRDNQFNISRQFCITDVQFDNDNNVLITEHYRRTVQLLDSDCKPLRVLMGCQSDLPSTLAVDVDGDVWINCSNGCVKIMRYQ